MTSRAPSYYGGKALTGPWIASLLPHGDCYVEPYAGMLGVLMARPKCDIEIVNDLNGDIANWWRVIRDMHDALARRVCLTPHCRELYDDARKVLAEERGDPVERAWALHTVLTQGIHSQTSGGNNWKRRFQGSHMRRYLHEDFVALAERMEGVQVDNTDAIRLLERVADVRSAVVYVDPPYYSAKREYAINDVPVQALTEALEMQKGSVAVSGYGDEWDHLGWRKETKEVPLGAGNPIKSERRVEVLWMNYPPAQTDLLSFADAVVDA